MKKENWDIKATLVEDISQSPFPDCKYEFDVEEPSDIALYQMALAWTNIEQRMCIVHDTRNGKKAARLFFLSEQEMKKAKSCFADLKENHPLMVDAPIREMLSSITSALNSF